MEVARSPHAKCMYFRKAKEEEADDFAIMKQTCQAGFYGKHLAFLKFNMSLFFKKKEKNQRVLR